FGTAIFSMQDPFASGRSEVLVHVVEAESEAQHHHLRVVQQLAELLRRTLGRLVLCGHPRLGGLLDELLADRMDAGIEGRDRTGTIGPCLRTLTELREQAIERLHPSNPNGRVTNGGRAAPAV